MEAYTYLAKYYDILMKDFNYESYCKHIKKYISGMGVDLCCGSGEMTIKLANLNANVLGVDISENMLNVARDKARKNFKNIIFIQSDILSFVPSKKVDFVTCVCDGINYIKPEKLEGLFKKIASYIKVGGYFIFDISSEYKLRNVLANNIFCEDLDLVTYIWKNKIKDNKISMDLSFFELDKDNIYNRFDEYHTQYIHNTNKLIEYLEKDFEVSCLDAQDFSQVKDTSKRALFILKRK